jgi:hypothetical protein
MASVRIYQKKQIRLDTLNVKQKQMFKLGTVSVASVRNRLALAQGPNDTPAKPLTKRWAIRKSKARKGNRRNLMYTGDMLRHFGVRTVTEKTAKARVAGGRKNSIKAWMNNKIEPWCVFSQKNLADVHRVWQVLVNEMGRRFVVERFLGKQ